MKNINEEKSKSNFLKKVKENKLVEKFLTREIIL